MYCCREIHVGHLRKDCTNERKEDFCYKCRQSGHRSSACPTAVQSKLSRKKSFVCYNCGSNEHSVAECTEQAKTFKFATCFTCNETGHLASQCPKGVRSIYPKGGCCHICGAVNHLAKHCLKDSNVAAARSSSRLASFKTPEILAASEAKKPNKFAKKDTLSKKDATKSVVKPSGDDDEVNYELD